MKAATTSPRPIDANGAPLGAALEDAFARFQPELLGTLYYLVGNVEDARDALQDTFVKCWRRRETISEIDNLKAWIFRVALNTARDLRTTAWRRRRTSLAEDQEMLATDASPVLADAMKREQLTLLRAAIGELRGEEQEVFLLRQNGQMTYDEIALSVGVPVGTVKTRMRLALARLRAALYEGDD